MLNIKNEKFLAILLIIVLLLTPFFYVFVPSSGRYQLVHKNDDLLIFDTKTGGIHSCIGPEEEGGSLTCKAVEKNYLY